MPPGPNLHRPTLHCTGIIMMIRNSERRPWPHWPAGAPGAAARDRPNFGGRCWRLGCQSPDCPGSNEGDQAALSPGLSAPTWGLATAGPA
jgi:hypothetical protein